MRWRRFPTLPSVASGGDLWGQSILCVKAPFSSGACETGPSGVSGGGREEGGGVTS